MIGVRVQGAIQRALVASVLVFLGLMLGSCGSDVDRDALRRELGMALSSIDGLMRNALEARQERYKGRAAVGRPFVPWSEWSPELHKLGLFSYDSVSSEVCDGLSVTQLICARKPDVKVFYVLSIDGGGEDAWAALAARTDHLFVFKRFPGAYETVVRPAPEGRKSLDIIREVFGKHRNEH